MRRFYKHKLEITLKNSLKNKKIQGLADFTNDTKLINQIM